MFAALSGVLVLCRLSEVAVPYVIWKENGYDVTIASPKGGPVPIDPTSR